MPIQKGEDWGQQAPLPDGALTVSSDLELRHEVERRIGQQRGQEALLGAPIGLLGGDLWRTLGGPTDASVARLHSADAFTAEVDVWEVAVDGAHCGVFVSHLVAHRRLWRGEFLVAMNSSWCGDLYLGPRAHPGDALVDVTYGSMRLQQRLLASRKARSGSHLPHPALATVRGAAVNHRLSGEVPVWADGELVAHGREIAVSLHGSAVQVVV